MNLTNVKSYATTAGRNQPENGENLRSCRVKIWFQYAVLSYMALTFVNPAFAARKADIAQSKHNLSASSGNDVRGATGTDEICVFCHTPHGARNAEGGPLWNRAESLAVYQNYDSSSLDAGVVDAPGGSSKLCLSCHDGTVAIGAVINKPGSAGVNTSANRPDPIAMVGTDAGMMPGGPYGELSGFTRKIGTDLTNDHPISFTYDSALAISDGEMVLPSPDLKQEIVSGGETIVGARNVAGLLTKPRLPLEKKGGPSSPAIDGQMQCATCHDPHIIETDMTPSGPALGETIKFLRANRFQLANPQQSFNKDNDIICLACHDKAGWELSVHAIGVGSEPGNDRYISGPETAKRDFPPNIPVYKAACLNCHDTHTESGAVRLTREGADSFNKPAIENTCYQCHSPSGTTIIEGPTGGSTEAPDIQTEFARLRHMPITTSDQLTATTDPNHSITDADFSETPQNLGKDTGNTSKRHVECTDCHNPHRVIRNSIFNGLGDSNQRVHTAGGSGDGSDGHIASGALRGSWGVEPTYGVMTSTWPMEPISFTVKQGYPSSTSTALGSTYLTREYQLCFKCHSNYALNSGDMPQLGGHGGATPLNTNGMTQYTNVAAEYAVNATNPPTSGTDQGEQGNSGTSCSGGDCDPFPSPPGDSGTPSGTDFNHRSWHPVIWPTGRDLAERAISPNANQIYNLRPPFRDNAGTQTMYCSDCHSNRLSWYPEVGDINTLAQDFSKVQGPHGSDWPFLLGGRWDTTVTPSSASGNNSSQSICGRCHNPRQSSGFRGPSGEASHNYTPKSNSWCMRCHIAVPHGWKNKAFLVNLNCVGVEGGQAPGCTQVGTALNHQTIAPYYNNAVLRIRNWNRSGGWQEPSCGRGANNSKDWMSDACG